MNKRSGRIAPTLLAAAVLLALAHTAAAQEANPPAASADATAQTSTEAQARAKNLGPVVVTGTRAGNRTESSSLTPIDVISADVLRQTGTIDLTQALERAIPSLNFPFAPASDTFAFQRPFELRGLSPDQVLVLVNGKRWHPGALVLSLGQIGQGSQGIDLNTIPMSAIDHIEVLRDGASAQYGSDALSGVINIILKKGAKGGDVQLSGGQFSAGDGRQWQGAANFGVPLGGDSGWLRITAENSNQSPSNRAGVDRRPGLAHLGVKFHFGTVSFKNKNLFLNTQYDISPDAQLYAFGHWGRRIGEPRGFYRYGSNTPYPNNPLIGLVYPDGFLPREHGDSTDTSLVVGLRGNWNGWRWDVSGNYGGNRVSYSTRNTVNYAMLNDFGSSPTSFHDGILTAKQQTFDIDISKDVSFGWLANPLTLSFGTQWLRQSYDVEAGDLGSYYVGNSGVRGGAQGFAGWGPQDAISVARHDVAEYLQLEGNLTERFGFSAALRHEDYSDFGATTSAALSGRFDFTDSFALRGSASTGFRAPGLGQQHYSETTSASFGVGNSLGLPPGIYLRGLVPVDNPLARLLGSEPLKAEKSRNFTAGVVWNPTNDLNLSFDAYQITVNNRIALSSSISLSTPAVISYLAANGITNLQYSGLSYFTNAGTVRTQGADVVASYRNDVGASGNLLSTLSYGYHKNKVTDVKPNPAVLDSLGVIFQRLNRSAIKGLLADTAPRSKLILDETYSVGPWTFNGTLTRYGRITTYGSTSYLNDIVYPHKWLLDVAASYSRDRWTFTLGSDNVLNTYPKKVPQTDDQNGAFPYSSSSPFGFMGAFVYGKVQYRW
ncbi:MAG: TonB-dependent receptor [Rhodanobacter sp.]|uniref:TonB-dependent receptor plug domain-containing protein n=1 Tax=Rhodanobacter sp. KK11 TaxID=3083255 RepID=UPI002966947A|nr:TonB-dependent receptor [Rhodanobacter sp. KK11]MDW2980108.1 TonB-dependent receptor [Rhodanobacter sp. KK11]